ncbi:hypothetical protein WDU94_005815 [Cyamophila willieti]
MSRPDLKKYKYVCYDCNFGFHQMAHLKRHFFTHTGEKPYNCIYCTYSSTHKYNIQKHLNEKHVPRYSCKHCKAYSTYNITEIIYHGKTCSFMLRPNLYKFKYVCYECNFGAYQIAHLKRHIYTHTGEKPYNCLYCSYSSTHKYNIQKHMKVHINKLENQFPCLYCKMRFDTSFDLLKHMTCVHSTFGLDCSKPTLTANSTT